MGEPDQQFDMRLSMMKSAGVSLAIVWASLAVGVGYNTWKAHEAFYEAQKVETIVDKLDDQWKATERRVNRRLDWQKRYMDKRFKSSDPVEK